MVDSYPLSMLQVGSTAIIQSSTSSGAIRRRLFDLGFSTGAKVKCIQSSPSGDPIAYSIRGTIIALRNETAQDILVQDDRLASNLSQKSDP
jgi:ferrous iron transport protein A